MISTTGTFDYNLFSYHNIFIIYHNWFEITIIKQLIGTDMCQTELK